MLYPNYAPSKHELRVANRFVEVRQSTIAGAGLGVFARRRTPAETHLSVYRGERLTPAEYNARYPAHVRPEYVMELSTCYSYVDASNPQHSNWVRYINAADHPGAPRDPNVQFREGARVYSLIEILPGQELFVKYSKDYEWDTDASSDGTDVTHINLLTNNEIL